MELWGNIVFLVDNLGSNVFLSEGWVVLHLKDRIKVGEIEDVTSASASPSSVREHGNTINSTG